MIGMLSWSLTDWMHMRNTGFDESDVSHGQESRLCYYVTAPPNSHWQLQLQKYNSKSSLNFILHISDCVSHCCMVCSQWACQIVVIDFWLNSIPMKLQTGTHMYKWIGRQTTSKKAEQWGGEPECTMQSSIIWLTKAIPLHDHTIHNTHVHRDYTLPLHMSKPCTW